MKIGTLTFHRTTNYGAILQAYALQKTLVSLGAKTEILDYRSPVLEARYKKNIFKYFFNPKNYLKAIIKNAYIRDNCKAFYKFSDDYLNVSSTIYNPQTIDGANQEYIAFIVGSDQVWNPICMGYDDNFYLSFSKKKKFSYAASFGLEDLGNNDKNWIKPYLTDFVSVSVREKAGVSLFNSITGNVAQCVLDPTLLLHDEWIEMGSLIDRVEKEKYILVYLLKETNSIFEEAKRYSKIHSTRIVYINDRLFGKLGIKIRYYTTPIEWLNLFIHADCIFTNSFHGTAFSINLHKKFFVELLPPPNKVNSRIINILELFNLSNRIIDSSKQDQYESSIDYSKVQEILNIEINRSLEYLTSIIKSVYNG